jgi:multiple sugar transport system permease protein
MGDVAVERAQSERHGSSGVVRGGRFRVSGVLRFAFIAAYTGFLLLPLYWMAVTSIKGQEDQLADPPVWFPSNPTSLNYSDALNNFNGWKSLQNSVVVAFVTTLLAVALGMAAAYSMARFRTGGKHLAFWFLSQRMMPPIAIIIPIFLLYSRYSEEWLGFTLIDTRAGLILLYTVFALPFTVWMMYAYFRQMPPELEEAALVDGCSRLQALRKIALPLAAPGIVSAAAFAFIFSWTEFLFAQVLARDDAITAPVALAGLITFFQGNLYGQASALTMVSLVPAVILGILVQRHLVRGLTLGAVQG